MFYYSISNIKALINVISSILYLNYKSSNIIILFIDKSWKFLYPIGSTALNPDSSDFISIICPVKCLVTIPNILLFHAYTLKSYLDPSVDISGGAYSCTNVSVGNWFNLFTDILSPLYTPFDP